MSKPAPKIFGYNKSVKPFTTKQNRMFFDMLKNNLRPTWKTLRTDNKREGKILWFGYNPKDTNHIWDRKPLILVLSTSKSHILGINFHWLEMPNRIKLINIILDINKTGKGTYRVPLQFTYKELKPYISKWWAVRFCIHKYIRKRMSPKAVLIHPKYLIDIARMDLKEMR